LAHAVGDHLPRGHEGRAGGLDELALGVGGDADGAELVDLCDLQRHATHTPARAEDQQRLPGLELDLVGEVVGGGAGHRDRRGVGEGDLLRLGHRLRGLEDRVLGEGAEAAGRGPEHLVPDGDVLDPLADAGHHSGRLEAHRDGQGPARAEGPFPALPVGGVHTGGADLDGDLAGSRPGGLALGELLALGAAVGGDDEDCRHEGLLLEGWEQCGARGCSAPVRPARGGPTGLIGADGQTVWFAPTACGVRSSTGPTGRLPACSRRRRSRRMALTITSSTEPSWTSMPMAMVTPPANTPASSATTVISAMAMFCRITETVLRARPMACGSFSRSSFIRAMSALSMATPVPAAPIATPMSAVASAGASLTPSPTIATV